MDLGQITARADGTFLQARQLYDKNGCCCPITKRQHRLLAQLVRVGAKGLTRVEFKTAHGYKADTKTHAPAMMLARLRQRLSVSGLAWRIVYEEGRYALVHLER